MGSQTGLDLDALLNRIHGNRTALDRLVNVMLEHLPHRIASLRSALEAGDSEALSRAAHTLKGSLSAFTIGPPWKACTTLEQAADAGDVPAMHAEFQRLAALIDDITVELQAHAASASSGNDGSGNDGSDNDGERTRTDPT